MVVGVMRLTLFLPENHSLKGKRQVLRAIKDRVRNKFNVSIAESDGHDMWQRAELGICQVGSDRAFVDSALREVVNFIDSLGPRAARRRAARNNQLLSGWRTQKRSTQNAKDFAKTRNFPPRLASKNRQNRLARFTPIFSVEEEITIDVL